MNKLSGNPINENEHHVEYNRRKPLNFGIMVGANPVTITFIGLVILSAALATAGASSRSGLVFGNSEWIAPKWAYTLGIGSVVLVMIAYALIGVPLANIMFPM